MVLVAIVVVLVALLGLRLFPVYMEYQKIKNTVTKMSNDQELKGATLTEIRKAFDRRAAIDEITAVGPQDLDISTEGGNVTVSVQYAKKVPLFSNISICIDFSTKAGE